MWSNLWKRIRPYISPAILGANIALVLAILYGKWPIGMWEVEKDKSGWTLYASYYTGILGSIGAFGALVTYLDSRRQKQEHFERTALDAQFTDILNRFADNDSPTLRANAAIRLAEMSREHLPGKPTEFNAENNPFFPRAASQLACALHMEENDSVLAEVEKALARMTSWVTENQAWPLLDLLIHELADANRNAKKEFIRVLGSSEEAPDGLEALALFCEPQQILRLCFRDLLETEQYTASHAANKSLGIAMTDEERRTARGRLPSAIQNNAARLIAARNALANALVSLPFPQLVPTELDALRSWQRTDVLLIWDCFLAGANLAGVPFQGVNLKGSFFHGASLQGANLQNSVLSDCKLTGTNLSHANLQNASLINVDMQFSQMIGVTLEGAGFDGAILNDVKWWYAADYNLDNLQPPYDYLMKKWPVPTTVTSANQPSPTIEDVHGYILSDSDTATQTVSQSNSPDSPTGAWSKRSSTACEELRLVSFCKCAAGGRRVHCAHEPMDRGRGAERNPHGCIPGAGHGRIAGRGAAAAGNGLCPD